MKSKNRYNNRFRLTSLAVLVFLIMGGVYLYYSQTLKQIEGVTTVMIAQSGEGCRFVRSLDGVCVSNKEDAGLWPVAVMIDNHPDAWPQYGLSQAQLVYNTLVEGGATRLMAVFTAHGDIKKIGPVRSVRPYYLTWVKELNAMLGHAGGSPQALEYIKDWKIIDWNEITSYGPRYFWRDHQRLAPHNLFTSNEKIDLARQEWGLNKKKNKFLVWSFSPQANNDFTRTAKSVYIDYSPGELFDVLYEYNTSTQTYLRWQNSQPHLDGLDQQQIKVVNLIVQFVPEEEHLDAKDRLAINTLGGGHAWIFIGGQVVEGKWTKRDLSARTIFYDKQDKEIVFKPGNIWIEVVPGQREVEIK